MPPAEPRVLVIDDELNVRKTLAMLLERNKYQASTAASAEEGLRLLKTLSVDLIITDLNLPGLSGLDLIRRLREGGAPHADVPIVMISGFGDTEEAIEAVRAGAADFVKKPYNNKELLVVIERALGTRSLIQENQALRAELKQKFWFGQLIGASERMMPVYDVIRRVKDQKVSCLLLGESGTGKEMVARAIHYSGARADQPFVAVNCAAIPEGLFESELFGHKRGAFTGAVSDRVGFLQAAHGGTLFLDEVGDMPPSAQVKLLRALAERKVTPVGDVKEVEVDVRLVTATNRNLGEDVRAGRFREDLYYRLKVVSVELPPLRERGEDVRLLAEHFLREYAREYQKRVRALHPDALERLHAHPWPGNVRELRNVMEAAVAMCEGDIVRPEDLPLEARAARPGGVGANPTLLAALSVEELPAEGIDLDALLSAYEERLLRAALAAAGGNKTRAADLCHITFRSFRHRWAKYAHGEDD